MKSLFYLLRTSLKNTLKELVHKPVRLVLYLVVIAAIVGVMALSAFNQQEASSLLPMGWLLGVYFAFVAFFLVLSIQKGLTSGDAIFEMNDVNLLFVSPINPRSILLYGLARLAKVSFWAGFFILFQSNTLAMFGVGVGGVLALFFVFIVTVIVLTILSLVIYSATNGKPGRKRWVKLLAVAVFLPFACQLALQLFTQGFTAESVLGTLYSPLLGAIPIAGWSAAGAIALLEGNILAGVLWLGLLLLGAAGMLAYIMFSRADYYEDVLVATETAFEKKRALAEGDMQATSVGDAKVRVTRTGISGTGASTLFYKHLRETFRQSRFGFFSLYSIIVGACAIAGSVFLRGELDVIVFLQILLWMQIFVVGNGRGLRELYSHYIYMIPAPPLKKVLWSNMEMVFKTLLESVVFLGLPGLILGDNLLVVLLAMLAYTLFTMLLLGINYLSMRVSEGTLSTGILIMLYLLAVLLIMLPGVAGALVVGLWVGGTLGMVLGLLILSAWELLAALVCFALSKGVLHNCDMPTMKQGGK